MLHFRVGVQYTFIQTFYKQVLILRTNYIQAALLCPRMGIVLLKLKIYKINEKLLYAHGKDSAHVLKMCMINAPLNLFLSSPDFHNQTSE